MSLERQLAEYGRLHEELFGPIAVDEITIPLADNRHEGTPSTQILLPPETPRRSRYAGPVWAVVAFVAILAVGALYLAFSSDEDQVADDPDVETMTDLEIIEAGVAALYSGDAERAVQLFELREPDDDIWIRSEAAFQAAIGGRLTLNCTEHAPGVFSCTVPYRNVFTDAIGWVDSPGDTLRVVVEDGAVVRFAPLCRSMCNSDGQTEIISGYPMSGFPRVYSFIDAGLAAYFSESGYGNPDCMQRSDDPIRNAPPSMECVQLVLDDLDGWAAWAETNLQRIAEEWGVTFPNTTPDVETMTDLEVIETAVAAFYSGDGERAAELFQLGPDVCPTICWPDQIRTDDQIREEAPYQAAIGGRVTLDCTEQATPGAFNCKVPYHNAATDAIGYVDQGGTIEVVVEDGVITEFSFPHHHWMVMQFGVLLATEGRLDGYEDCEYGPFPESCATIQMENLDRWVEWRENVDRTKIVEAALNSWYGGDCPTARWLSGRLFDCSESSVETQTIEYESILGAQVSVENCEATSTDSVSCEVQYSSAMNSAVGEPPSVTVREFIVSGPAPDVNGVFFVDDARQDLAPWFRSIWGGFAINVYPEDTELRESFTLFAEGGELADEYAAADCASTRTPECATLILDNLDDWAAWYETNS